MLGDPFMLVPTATGEENPTLLLTDSAFNAWGADHGPLAGGLLAPPLALPFDLPLPPPRPAPLFLLKRAPARAQTAQHRPSHREASR